MMSIKAKIRSKMIELFFALKENTYKTRVKYIYENNHSDKLIIVFPAFHSGNKPIYNYYKTLKDVKMDKLFLLDNFGYRGSYLIYEKGEEISSLIIELLRTFLNKSYSRVITLGSSKGGTCAIYFGLKIGAHDIYSGACQYFIGSYLNTEAHKDVFEGMMGKGAGEYHVKLLDNTLHECINSYRGKNTIIHLFYSKKEHTYEDHITSLIKDLDNSGISHTDTIVNFSSHSEVGKHFGPFIKKRLLGYNR